MGWITKIIILALIIGALMYFAPDTSHKAKDWLVDQAKNLSLDNFEGNETFYCLNDEDCTNHFGFEGLICNNNTCAIGEQNELLGNNNTNTTTQ